jgi:DNA-binding NarL/FixJ family response regulator
VVAASCFQQTGSVPGAHALDVVVVATTPIAQRGITAIFQDAGWRVVSGAGGSRPALLVCELPIAGTASDIARVRESSGGAPILVIVADATPAFLAELVAAGAAGAIDRGVDEAMLVQTALAVAGGRTVINAGGFAEAGSGRPPALTRRELQVLELLCSGRTNHEIAEILVISDNTVKNHVRRLYEKLQVRSRTEAVVRAARWGLVRLGVDEGDSGGPLPAGAS